MEIPSGVTLLSRAGEETLEKNLRAAGFAVTVVSDPDSVPPGVVVVEIASPARALELLSGARSVPGYLRDRGYTVLAAVSPETFADERVALDVAGAHSYYLLDDTPVSVRASVLAAHKRRELDEVRRSSEERYKLLAENAGDVIWTWDLRSGRYDYVSPSIQRLRGLTAEEALAESLVDSLTPDSYLNAMEKLGAGLESLARGERPGPITDYYRQPCKDGTVKTVEITTSVVCDAAGVPIQFLGVSRDATERVRDKANLESALRRSELLLLELEHRVRNTLALTASLLSLASEYVRDPADFILFEESKGRISALALVYDKLLDSPDVAHISLGAYLEDLVRSVVSAFSRKDCQVDLATEKEDVVVDSKKAAIMGLAVNELVTNALKYAVRPGKRLTLRLEVRRDGEGAISVRLADDGPGLPPGFDWERTEGLGFLLIRNLSAQLGGVFLVETGVPGAAFQFHLPYDIGDGHPADGRPAGDVSDSLRQTWAAQRPSSQTRRRM
ncbi:MAG TPA: histidine kinase dimerization/phosphoacceptor domain -containing protein [Magnetospirillaceae bacterium]|nr:histidine kinase dimerization/phosphoacceptor domain -containing protein [Magnetospirillaceae bacterium]